MQTITPELEAILKDHFQAGASGFRGRIEVDVPSAAGEPSLITYVGAGLGFGSTIGNGSGPVTDRPSLPSGWQVGDIWLLLVETANETVTTPSGWTEVAGSPQGTGTAGGSSSTRLTVFYRRAQAGDTRPDIADAGNHVACGLIGFRGCTASGSPINASAGGVVGSASTSVFLGGLTTTQPGCLIVQAAANATDIASAEYSAWANASLESVAQGSAGNTPEGNGGGTGSLYGIKTTAGVVSDGSATLAHASVQAWVTIALEPEIAAASVTTVGYTARLIAKEKSRKLLAAQMTVRIPNESGSGSQFPSQAALIENNVIRAYQWYGDAANEVQTFEGLIDQVTEHRDPRWVEITCRDMLKRAIVQGFSASAPQGAEEGGALRTAANGVYLNLEVSDIVADMADRMGWPTAKRDIAPTSFAISEYVVGDGLSWADAIAGEHALTELVGYELWATETGVLTFRPTGQDSSADTDTPQVPAYTFRSGEDLLELDLAIDDYDRKTRLKVSGPLTTAQPAWIEAWHTNVIKLPVGLAYVAADPDAIYVLDRGTTKIYRVLQADRTIASSLDIGGSITSPLGLSGDPSDATIWWVLEAQWRTTGTLTGNKIHKVRKSDGVVLASHAIASQRWTSIKADASAVWAANWDTDKLHELSKVDGSEISSHTVPFEAVDQINPSGVAVDGTTLLAFFYGAGGLPRFLLLDRANPSAGIDTTNALGVTDGYVSTAGTQILGGEMDTTTHADLYACSDSLGLVWRYNLTQPVTSEVAVEVSDVALEDELGARAQAEPRVHDLHAGDPAHPWEARRETMALKAVTSLAQAAEAGARRLPILSQRRVVLDGGIIGNPALQLRDMIRVEDPPSSIAHNWLLDTYRDVMDAEAGTYLGTVALLPWQALY